MRKTRLRNVKMRPRRYNGLGASAAANLWTPDRLPGKRRWGNPSSLSLNDGDAIATFTDSSSAAQDIANGTAAQRPTYKTAILNGYPIARFDGGDQLFSGTFSFGASPAGLSYACVYRFTAASAFQMVQTYSLNNWELMHNAAGDVPSFNYDTGAGTNLLVSSTGAVATNTWVIVIATFDDATNTVEIFVNGTSGGSAINAAASPSAGGTYALGARGGGSFFMAGDIAQEIVGDRAWSTTDRQKLEGYFAHRFGLTGNLPGGHPYKTTPPTV